jgi:hypothetical protein
MHSGGPNIFILGYFWGRICLGGDALLSKQVRVSPSCPTKKLHKGSQFLHIRRYITLLSGLPQLQSPIWSYWSWEVQRGKVQCRGTLKVQEIFHFMSHHKLGINI